jgi:hypothetical protein
LVGGSGRRGFTSPKVKRRVAATVGSSERTILVTTHPFTTMRRRAVTTVHSSERAILVTTHPLTTMM